MKYWKNWIKFWQHVTNLVPRAISFLTLDMTLRPWFGLLQYPIRSRHFWREKCRLDRWKIATLNTIMQNVLIDNIRKKSYSDWSILKQKYYLLNELRKFFLVCNEIKGWINKPSNVGFFTLFNLRERRRVHAKNFLFFEKYIMKILF